MKPGILKRKMIVVISLLLTAFVLVAGFSALAYFKNRLKENIAAQQFVLICALAEQIEAKVDAMKQELAVYSTILPPEILKNRKRAQHYLDSRFNDTVVFNNGVYLFDAAGTLVASIPHDEALTGKSFAHRDYLAKTIRTKRAVMSEPFFSSQPHHHPVIMLTAPLIGPDGSIHGVLCGSIDLLRENFVANPETVHLTKGGYLYVFDRHRNILVHPDPQRILKHQVPPGINRLFDAATQGFEGSGETITSRGIPSISSFKRIDRTDWIVAAHYPVEEAYAPVHAATRTFLLMLSMFLVVAIPIIRLVMKRLTAPLDLFINRQQAEAALRESERKFRILSENAPIGIFQCDTAGHCMYCNSVLNQIAGLDGNCCDGSRTLLDIMHPDDRERLQGEWEICLKEGRTWQAEHRVIRDDGVTVWVRTTTAPLQEAEGLAGGFVGTIEDISDQKKGEAVLRRRNVQLQVLTGATQEVNDVLDSRVIVRSLVQSAMKLVGGTAGAAGMIQGSQMVLQEYHDGDQILSTNFRFPSGRGIAGILMETRMAYVCNDPANDANIIPEVRDFLSLRNMVAIPIFNRDGEVRGCIEIHNKEGGEPFDDNDVTLLQGLASSAAVALENAGMVAELRQAEEQLTAARDFYLSLLDDFPALIWKTGMDGRCNYLNRTWLDFTGWGVEEKLWDGWLESVHPEDRASYAAVVASACADRKPVQVEYRLRRHDGVYRRVLDKGRPFSDLEGRFAGFIGVCFDISDEKEFQELETRRRKSAEAMATAILTFIQTGTLAEITWLLAKEAVEFTGAAFGMFYRLRPEGDAEVVACVAASHMRDNRILWQIHEDVEAGKQVHLPVSDSIMFSPVATGASVRVSDRRPTERDADQGGLTFDTFLGIPVRHGRDIAGVLLVAGKQEPFSSQDQQEMENFGGIVALAMRSLQAEEERLEAMEGLRQAQKMEAVGQLAGGIAHDFNNLLTVISGYTTILRRQLREEKLATYADKIGTAAERAAELTQQLLAFSRKQIMERKVVNINRLIENLQKIMERLIPENIEVRTSFAGDIGMVKADPGQIEQILLNLVVNARDAITQSGEIVIGTSNREIDQPFVAANPGAIPGNYVMFSVSDNGCGMAPDVQKRIFEPFYTTKEQGRGTGLGLATVYGIVKQSGGYIAVRSRKREGSTFEVYLPRAAETEPAEKVPAPVTQVRQGTETILVVEDQEDVLNLTVHTLRPLGYNVIRCSHPSQAAQLLEAQGTIDLLLTDVIMPTMSGPDLARLLKNHIENLKVIFMSGYADPGIADDDLVRHGGALLRKPFSPDMLAHKVREVLGER